MNQSFPDTQPKHSLRAFLRSFYNGCKMHGYCFPEPSENDLKVESCPVCSEPFVCSW